MNHMLCYIKYAAQILHTYILSVKKTQFCIVNNSNSLKLNLLISILNIATICCMWVLMQSQSSFFHKLYFFKAFKFRSNPEAM